MAKNNFSIKDSCENAYLKFAQPDTFPVDTGTPYCQLTIFKHWQQRYNFVTITTNPSNPNEIAYIKRDELDHNPKSRLKLCKFNFCTGKETCLIEGLYGSLLDWSTQGYLLFNFGGSVIYSIKDDGTQLEQLTFDGNYNYGAKWCLKGECFIYRKTVQGLYLGPIFANKNGQHMDTLDEIIGSNIYAWIDPSIIIVDDWDNSQIKISFFNIMSQTHKFVESNIQDVSPYLQNAILSNDSTHLFWQNFKGAFKTNLQTNLRDTLISYRNYSEMNGFSKASNGYPIYFTRNDYEEIDECNHKAWSNIFAFNPTTNEIWRLNLGVQDSSAKVDTTGYNIGIGVENFFFKEQNNMFVYPNPTNQNQINLSFSLPLQQITTVRVFNYQGVLVKETTLPIGQQLHLMDVSTLSSGLYFIKTNSSNGSQLLKFVKY